MEKKEIIIPARGSEKLAPFIERIFKEPALLDALPDVMYVKAGATLAKLLTGRRLEILRELKRNPDLSSGKLAARLKRSPQAVSRDLSLLAKHGFIELKREGRSARPRVRYSWILFPVSASA